MKQVFIRQGRAEVENVPAPQTEPGTVLVQVDHSCISIGTEMSGVRSSGAPLWKRALKQPEKVKKVLTMAATQGVGYTRSVVKGQLEAGLPTGYSAAGTVINVGEGVTALRVGDRVACAGAQCAFHAEIICVPVNLVVKLPEGLSFPEASTVTLGAIALQGVRRAQPTLGETFVVLGLGVLGQLTSQMLQANGCRVIGVDLDRGRIKIAHDLGINSGIHPEDSDNIEQVVRLTDGIGADGVIITAATSSDAVVSTAFNMCRKKGRVVLVGDVGLNLNRADFYQKEIDFFISSSYGPGRYDRRYEEEGLDYPVSYVRWTENRNMAEYLRLLNEDKVLVEPMIDEVFSIDQATKAYESLKGEGCKSLMVLLSYPGAVCSTDSRVTINPVAKAVGDRRIRVAVVGAGGFAKGMHLPNLQSLDDQYHIQAIVSRSGHNATTTAKQFSADYATTDYQQVIDDPDVDAVLITTRHDLHSNMALEALMAGKHVLVEKPLALCSSELLAIKNYFTDAKEGSVPVLLTGFNRRFSPFAKRAKEIVDGRTNPMILNYRMNAGYIPLDHWVHGAEGGGRNIGEACHIYDLFTYLTGSEVESIQVNNVCPKTNYYSPRDNFITVVSFRDGSLATLTYTALGSNEFPKEQLEIFTDGKVLMLDDYLKLEVYGANIQGVSTKKQDKGHMSELIAFSKTIHEGCVWPIPLWEQLQSMEISMVVESQLECNRTELLTTISDNEE